MTFGSSAWFPASCLAWATCAFILTHDPLGKASCTKATFSASEVWLQLSVSSLRHSNYVVSSVPPLGAPPKEFPTQALVPAITSESCPVYEAVWWRWRAVTKWHSEHLDVKRLEGEVPFWIRKETIFPGVLFELFSELCHEGLRQHVRRTWNSFFPRSAPACAVKCGRHSNVIGKSGFSLRTTNFQINHTHSFLKSCAENMCFILKLECYLKPEC